MASRPNKSPILISACLAGINCTYNANNRLNPAVRNIFLSGNCLLVCPEVMGGLPTPRTPAEIVGGDGSDVLRKKARVITSCGKDVTREYLRGVSIALRLVKRYRVRNAILKANSPCCGTGQIYDGTFKRTLKKGDGIFASALIRRGVTVFSEKDLKACAKRCKITTKHGKRRLPLLQNSE